MVVRQTIDLSFISPLSWRQFRRNGAKETRKQSRIAMVRAAVNALLLRIKCWCAVDLELRA